MFGCSLLQFMKRASQKEEKVKKTYHYYRKCKNRWILQKHYYQMMAAVSVHGLLSWSVIAILTVLIIGLAFLWIYGRFFIAIPVILCGGVLFRLSHELVVVFIMTLYSVYCGRAYIGWKSTLFPGSISLGLKWHVFLNLLSVVAELYLQAIMNHKHLSI